MVDDEAISVSNVIRNDHSRRRHTIGAQDIPSTICPSLSNPKETNESTSGCKWVFGDKKRNAGLSALNGV